MLSVLDLAEQSGEWFARLPLTLRTAQEAARMDESKSNSIRYARIPNYPDYMAGTDGSVWSTKSGRLVRMKATLDRSNGRPRLNLRAPGVGPNRSRLSYVGRIVLETFVGPPPDGADQCCHFPDRDPLNCSLGNLRWGTYKDNTQDQRIHGTLVGGEHHGMARLSNETVASIRALGPSFTRAAIARRFGVSASHVTNIVNNKARTPSSQNGRGL